ncbi:MAG TPA: precorrin-4 C(11)-methyltransferase [Oligoflexus sp.]|uniref:precorrin-4 C(11)-methyltransferase n=1 Tax=Oligoflexus sp. TaxID=1971216 RepID=UPI002D38233F|nr:precorrin-4 C(11)-methyltransferase [Oligoflexus sp.]HYX35497.1 precorrin-4 C(11)-methyltransferase [Oligoflexus sp.]
MTVYIIGAGPGDPDLITVKGRRLIQTCPVVLYTGSLVPRALLQDTAPDAFIADTSSMNLDEIIGHMKAAHDRGQDVARVHTGDPMIYGSTAEQMRRCDALGIPYQVIPGVSSYAAAAAALSQELTLPELSQTVIISRCEGRTPMPEGEDLVALAQHKATLVLFLSVAMIKKITRQLRPLLGDDCPVAIVYKATWPDQLILRGTLENISAQVTDAKITSHSIIIIGRVLGTTDFAESRLYASDFSHGFRKAKVEESLT